MRDDNTTYNNRLDTTLSDVFSLLSLFYLTIGKTKDTLATYCQIASMRVSAFVLFRACPDRSSYERTAPSYCHYSYPIPDLLANSESHERIRGIQ